MNDMTGRDDAAVSDPTTPDPRQIARSVALATAEGDGQVGGFLTRLDAGDGVSDFRFEATVPGYEHWQWSITLFHNEDDDSWTVDESTLVPGDDALMPPRWIPWKERLLPTDLSVTDVLGTDPDDERLEEGVPDERDGGAEGSDGTDGSVREQDAPQGGATLPAAEAAPAGSSDDAAEPAESVESAEDRRQAINEFELSRRHVLSALGRSQTAKRWYEGPHGPKSLSTKTAAGETCATCGFFVPLKGELNLMFGVCANKWSLDDGKVVSLDHGCGEHSEIRPPEPTRLWRQTKPAFDDMRIDIIHQVPRDENAAVEIIEDRIAGSKDVDDAQAVTNDDVQNGGTDEGSVQAQDAQTEDSQAGETSQDAVPSTPEEEDKAEQAAGSAMTEDAGTTEAGMRTPDGAPAESPARDSGVSAEDSGVAQDAVEPSEPAGSVEPTEGIEQMGSADGAGDEGNE